ncbi:MAG: hypothetical protein FWD31_09000 [Planctomycetaceae bacterium]|nr:hypothetical protein [Planctomycetaceae bacterium]
MKMNFKIPWFFGAILFVLPMVCSCRHSAAPETQIGPEVNAPPIRQTEQVEKIEQVEQIETLVAEAVKKSGGLVARDAKTGRITEVDVAANRSSVDDAAFSAIVQLTGLKKLSLSGGSLSEESLKKLESLRSLEELLLVDTITTDDDLAALCRNLKNLRRLTLRRLTKLSDQGLKSLHSLKELRNLALLNLPIGGPGLESVTSLSSLRALDLRGCNQLNSEDYLLLTKMTALTDLKIGGTSINADVLRTVATLPNLSGLTVEDATVTVDLWEELFANPRWSENMTSLAFARMYSVSDRVLEKLANFKKLKSLSLRAAPVRGSFVRNLPADSPLLANLQTLGMTKNYATPEEIFQLKQFKNLKKLDFSVTPMTLEKIEALSTLDQIEVLMLAECQLTDELVEKLVPLQNLSVLEIDNNPSLTDKTQETLKRFPKLNASM